jgi:CTP:molybdopterin cytidylyltransferase MocA
MPDELLVAILAAGASRRLGRPKQLVEVAGEPLVRRICRMAIDAAVGPTAVVLGCRRQEITPLLADLPLMILINDAWEEGMASSVRAATRAAVDLQVAALLLLHADQYALTCDDLVHLRDAWRRSPGCCCLSRDGEHFGPPAILPATRFDQMLTLSGDTGPRAILHADPRIAEIQIPGASRDIDCPSDLPCCSPAAAPPIRRS